MSPEIVYISVLFGSFFFLFFFFSWHCWTIEVHDGKSKQNQHAIPFPHCKTPVWANRRDSCAIKSTLSTTCNINASVRFLLLSHSLQHRNCTLKGTKNRCKTIEDVFLLRRFSDYGKKKTKICGSLNMERRKIIEVNNRMHCLFNAILFMLHDRNSNHTRTRMHVTINEKERESHCWTEWMQWWHKLVNRFKSLSNRLTMAARKKKHHGALTMHTMQTIDREKMQLYDALSSISSKQTGSVHFFFRCVNNIRLILIKLR